MKRRDLLKSFVFAPFVGLFKRKAIEKIKCPDCPDEDESDVCEDSTCPYVIDSDEVWTMASSNNNNYNINYDYFYKKDIGETVVDVQSYKNITWCLTESGIHRKSPDTGRWKTTMRF